MRQGLVFFGGENDINQKAQNLNNTALTGTIVM